MDIELFLLVLKLSESLRRFLFLLEWGLNHFDDGDLIWQEVDDEISLKISDCFAIQSPVLLFKHVKSDILEGLGVLIPELHFVVLVGQEHPHHLREWLGVRVLQGHQEVCFVGSSHWAVLNCIVGSTDAVVKTLGSFFQVDS